MELSEFTEKGYKINAQVPVVDTREVDLDNLLDGYDVDQSLGDVIDTWIDDSESANKVSYDVIDPDGELISGYGPTLFTDKDVREFIAKL